ncbi:MAG: phosphoribosylanthranilate isomerase [Tannerella sp.]|jgi:phosphoribosylanthranilate isomerase|nr:phosphoribosylanthranilate isomerase [Tannerella sp.]
MIIKVCGMRVPENIRDIGTLDIDIMGFIFYPGSPRYVSENDAGRDAILAAGKKKAGVFVNETPEKLNGCARRYRLDYIQLHGNESPGTCETLKKQGYSVIKAFPVAAKADFKLTENYSCCVDYFLFDTKCVGYGGSGKRFDWHLLDEYKGDTPFLISGGLTPDCVDDIRLLNHPLFSGIDLNSGFETSPAVKDSVKLKDFICKIRSLPSDMELT